MMEINQGMNYLGIIINDWRKFLKSKILLILELHFTASLFIESFIEPYFSISQFVLFGSF